MNRKAKVVIGISAAVIGLAWFVWYFFFDFDHSTISDGILTYKGNTYTYESVADQTNTKLKTRAIGKTLDGDLVFEMVGDPSNNYVIVIPDTEMLPWMLYKKTQKK